MPFWKKVIFYNFFEYLVIIRNYICECLSNTCQYLIIFANIRYCVRTYLLGAPYPESSPSSLAGPPRPLAPVAGTVRVAWPLRALPGHPAGGPPPTPPSMNFSAHLHRQSQELGNWSPRLWNWKITLILGRCFQVWPVWDKRFEGVHCIKWPCGPK